MWNYRFIHVIELVVRPCGCPLAWTKFPSSESPTLIIELLYTLYPTAESYPTFIALDKACRVVYSMLARRVIGPWKAEEPPISLAEDWWKHQNSWLIHSTIGTTRIQRFAAGFAILLHRMVHNLIY
ncbi:hypothetical protein DL93DRAFT_2189558 [Clavulina sp. PMI_390]|nr:hypothetical protein DL93DRAFT_2189558 [Clavulina sp. PMI_390]